MPIVASGLEAAVSEAGKEPFLRGLSLTLQSGQMTLVVGTTGAGKSTLLDALTGLRPLQGGCVEIDGMPLWRGRRVNPEANRLLGAVFQQPEQGLFAATVRQELQYTLRPLGLSREEAEGRIRRALDTVELPPDALVQSPFTLSTGQQRRVALASAAAAEPIWLFLDEPTAALDPAGVEALVRWLELRRAATGCGVVIATHDLDTFLPLADRVLVLKHGAIAADAAPQELAVRPELLLRAGVGLPAYMETALQLQKAGIPVTASPSVQETAAAIARVLRERHEFTSRELAAALTELSPELDRPTVAYKASDSAVFAELAAAGGISGYRAVEKRGLAYFLDPRAKWLFLLFATTGMLLQHTWEGLACSAAAAIAVAVLTRFPLRRYTGLWRTYLLFTGISMTVAGIQWGTHPRGELVWFSLVDALSTGFPLLRLLPAMMLGLLFARTTSPMEVKRGLEQGLAFVRPLRHVLELLTFATAMLFRLVPLLTGLWERFSRIVRIRGKSRAKPGTVGIRDLPVVLTPLLVTSFQLAEQLAAAVEARGFRLGKSRTSSVRLQLRRRDWWTILAGAGLLVGFILLK